MRENTLSDFLQTTNKADGLVMLAQRYKLLVSLTFLLHKLHFSL